jgi:hypothetical protein
MWSHYGDEHKGVCAGYSVPADAAANLSNMTYGGSRSVSARDVQAMVAGDERARQRVDRAVLFTKAEDWQYEKEWRLIGPRGPRASPLELTQVIFGLKCGISVRHSIITALMDRSKPIKFYEIREREGTFDLSKRLYDYDELLTQFPKRSRDVPDLLKAAGKKRRKKL